MANTYESKKAQALTGLLKRINQGEDLNHLCKEANLLVTNVDPKDIATARQNLIDEGYSAQLVQQLSATLMLMGIFEKQSVNPETLLPPNHILRLVMVEHDLIRCFLADLNDVVEAIQCTNQLSDVSSEFRKLAHIIEHLSAMKEHIDREEDVIFPYLRKRGWMNLCPAAQGEHLNIKTEIDNLVALIVSFNKVNLEEFKVRLIAVTQRFLPTVLDHLFEEDNTLYPIVLGVIDDVKVWEKMKALCDQIGYCGVHL